MPGKKVQGLSLQDPGWTRAARRRQEPRTREVVAGLPRALLLAPHSAPADPERQVRKQKRQETALPHPESPRGFQGVARLVATQVWWREGISEPTGRGVDASLASCGSVTWTAPPRAMLFLSVKPGCCRSDDSGTPDVQ